MRNFITILGNRLPQRQQALLNSISTNAEIAIYLEDNEASGKTVFIADSVSEEYLANKCFKIDNVASKEILLWAIDGGFVRTGRPLSVIYPRKCDCAFGFENFIGFVEFKVNADPLAHWKTVLANRESACEQIGQTIYFIRDALGLTDFLKIEGYTFEAYICTPPTYPSKATAIDSLAIEFLETHRIGLFETSEKVCQ
jgi:hypothetical protein